jgi:ATP-dependent Zn protease
MVCELGMDEEYGIRTNEEYLRSLEARNSPGFRRVEESVDRVLKEQMDKTVALLKTNRQHLEAVADLLVDKERLSEEQLREILPVTPNAEHV